MNSFSGYTRLSIEKLARQESFIRSFLVHRCLSCQPDLSVFVAQAHENLPLPVSLLASFHLLRLEHLKLGLLLTKKPGTRVQRIACGAKRMEMHSRQRCCGEGGFEGPCCLPAFFLIRLESQAEALYLSADASQYLLFLVECQFSEPQHRVQCKAVGHCLARERQKAFQNVSSRAALRRLLLQEPVQVGEYLQSTV